MSPFKECVELAAMSLDAIWLDAPVPRSMTKTAGCLVAGGNANSSIQCATLPSNARGGDLRNKHAGVGLGLELAKAIVSIKLSGKRFPENEGNSSW